MTKPTAAFLVGRMHDKLEAGKGTAQNVRDAYSNIDSLRVWQHLKLSPPGGILFKTLVGILETRYGLNKRGVE